MNDTIALLRWGYFVYINKLLILHPIHVQLVFKRPVFLYGFFVVYLLRQVTLRQLSCFFVPLAAMQGVFVYMGIMYILA